MVRRALRYPHERGELDRDVAALGEHVAATRQSYNLQTDNGRGIGETARQLDVALRRQR